MLRRLPITRAVVGVSVTRGPRRAVMRTTVRWMLPAAGALATALAMAPNAEASGFFSSEPTSPTVVDTPLTWSFAANGGEQCDLSSDAGVTDSRPCGTGQYQYTPTTAGTYTLTV